VPIDSSPIYFSQIKLRILKKNGQNLFVAHKQSHYNRVGGFFKGLDNLFNVLNEQFNGLKNFFKGLNNLSKGLNNLFNGLESFSKVLENFSKRLNNFFKILEKRFLPLQDWPGTPRMRAVYVKQQVFRATGDR
jgi:uncharacterized phage infection (PIP) family protein YhgE